MSSTFIALPLSSGEAFLLRTTDNDGHERVILVDSGKKYGEGTRELAKVLSEISPSIGHIDFAICTHSDADHSQGFWSFADDWYGLGRTLGEYWLPGGWANAMPSILVDPTGFAAKLMDGATRASLDVRSNDDALTNVSREQSHYIASRDLDVESRSNALVALDYQSQPSLEAAMGLSADEAALLLIDREETDDIIDAFDAVSKPDLLKSAVFWTQYGILFGRLHPDNSLTALSEASVSFQEVAETAQAIRKIALAALSYKIRIRWFDFGKYKQTNIPKGGEPGLLEPCCAVEVRPDRRKTRKLSNLMLFHSLRLTRQNVESLVFYRPETDDEPGVLLLGDSRLAHGIANPGPPFPRPFDKPKRKLLITAPHHGSRNNDYAYGVLAEWLGTDEQYYVRNGGQAGQTLDAYIQHKNRRCAQCIQCHGKCWRRWVSVSTNGNEWKWPPSADECGSPQQNSLQPA